MRNTGVILKVLPHVHANGTIQLEIEQEISNVVNPNQQTLTPTISQRRVRSTVAVSSGQIVLLGGLISEQDQNTKDGIPGLNDIEFLGNLSGTKSVQEIIMFIKPQLVRNSIDDARRVAEHVVRDCGFTVSKAGFHIGSERCSGRPWPRAGYGSPKIERLLRRSPELPPQT
jgi:general secretion pathway protein D